MVYTQAHRHLAFISPLGEDVVLLKELHGQEGISRLFHFDLELVSEDPAIDFTAVMGKNVTVRITQADGTDRYFNGVVSRFSQAGSSAQLTSYHVEMVPWLWLLTRTADCKIFQEMTIPDIIEAIFTTYGFNDFRNSLQGSYPVREYCVQYRETDFNFISRLMEQYGIFYYFEHENGSHTLVLADSNAEFDPCPGQPQARYQITHGAAKTDEDIVTGWIVEQEVRPAKYSLMDFNFETPAVNLQVNVDSAQPPPGGMAFEIYDYPGEYLVRDDGDSLANVRIEEEGARSVVIDGTSNCRPFTSGYTFELLEHPRDDQNQAYVLTSIEHSGMEGTYEAGDPAGGFTYSNRFTCLPLSLAFRPSRITPRPVIQGLQTAIVAGVAGEELYVDSYGRIKVQFHWDRLGQRDENSSCWIRVAQNWAGKRWGAVFLPRIGQEVLVGFLEGDPDQPIITGCVYNGDQIQPYDLPTYQTRSTIRSDTTLGGNGCNEIRFEDKAGSEEVYLHSQGDLNIRAEGDRHETIIGERHLSVYKAKHEDVGESSYVKITTDQVVAIGQDMSHKIGGDLIVKVAGSHVEDTQTEIYLRSNRVVIEAATEITLKGPGGFVKIDSTGVTIQGTMVLINSGGAPGTGTSREPKPLTEIVGVDPAGVGSPDFNIFYPTTVSDASNASGSSAFEPVPEDDGEDG